MQDIVDHWRDVGLHSVRRGRKGGFCRKDIYFQRIFLAFLWRTDTGGSRGTRSLVLDFVFCIISTSFFDLLFNSARHVFNSILRKNALKVNSLCLCMPKKVFILSLHVKNIPTGYTLLT